LQTAVTPKAFFARLGCTPVPRFRPGPSKAVRSFIFSCYLSSKYDARNPGQDFFDLFAENAGCAHASGSAGLFDCLRDIPLDNIRKAMGAPSYFTYQVRFALGFCHQLLMQITKSFALSWSPREDGTFMTGLAHDLLLQGKIADIPFVTGAQPSHSNLSRTHGITRRL
jgi:hypothetical protein